MAVRSLQRCIRMARITGDSPQRAAGLWVAGLYHPHEGEQTIKKRSIRAMCRLRLRSSEEIVSCQPADELLFAVLAGVALSSAWKSVEVCKISGSNCPCGMRGPYTTSSGMPKRPKP